jgi:hypothetical protein
MMKTRQAAVNWWGGGLEKKEIRGPRYKKERLGIKEERRKSRREQ